jgi:hypothetical protein
VSKQAIGRRQQAIGTAKKNTTPKGMAFFIMQLIE